MSDIRLELLTKIIRNTLLREVEVTRLLTDLCGTVDPRDRARLEKFASEAANTISGYMLMFLEETAKRHDGVIPGLDSET